MIWSTNITNGVLLQLWIKAMGGGGLTNFTGSVIPLYQDFNHSSGFNLYLAYDQKKNWFKDGTTLYNFRWDRPVYVHSQVHFPMLNLCRWPVWCDRTSTGSDNFHFMCRLAIHLIKSNGSCIYDLDMLVLIRWWLKDSSVLFGCVVESLTFPLSLPAPFHRYCSSFSNRLSFSVSDR